jgi:hypothetical protein
MVEQSMIPKDRRMDDADSGKRNFDALEAPLREIQIDGVDDTMEVIESLSVNDDAVGRIHSSTDVEQTLSAVDSPKVSFGLQNLQTMT